MPGVVVLRKAARLALTGPPGANGKVRARWSTRGNPAPPGSNFINMLNWKAGAAKISKHVTTLSISWLNNQFVAMSIHRGVVEETWTTALAADTEPDFAALVREAVQKTKYRGTKVSLLLANPRLAQKLVDVPPVTGSGLIKIVQREAQHQKFFPDEAVWAFQSSLTVKGVQRVIMHLLPKSLLEQFMTACQKNGQFLNSVVPVSAVLHQQLTRLPLKKDDVAMLAAETGGFTTVVVGRVDGQLLLVRTLLGDWNTNVERLMVDLKRTIAFVTQQFDVNINAGVWLFGPGAEQQAPVLQLLLGHSVCVSPVEYRPDYWAMQSAKLPPAMAPNFMGPDLQQAPRRKLFARVVAVGTALLVLASGGVAFALHFLAKQETTITDTLSKRAVLLATQRQNLEERNAEYAGKEQLNNLVLDDRRPPVPAWMAGYLGDTVPAELAVTNLHVQWDNQLWTLHLGGCLQSTGKPPVVVTLSNSVAELADRLETGPFHLLIRQRSDRLEPVREKPDAAGGAPARPARPTPGETQFWIEGVMR